MKSEKLVLLHIRYDFAGDEEEIVLSGNKKGNCSLQWSLVEEKFLQGLIEKKMEKRR